MPTTRLPIDDADLAAFCRRRMVRRLSLFGSTLRRSAGPESDIDLLVEFEPGGKPGLIAFAAMEQELSDLMGGRRVDLRTAEDLSPYFRDEVVSSAEMQYGPRG